MKKKTLKMWSFKKFIQVESIQEVNKYYNTAYTDWIDMLGQEWAESGSMEKDYETYVKWFMRTQTKLGQALL